MDVGAGGCVHPSWIRLSERLVGFQEGLDRVYVILEFLSSVGASLPT